MLKVMSAITSESSAHTEKNSLWHHTAQEVLQAAGARRSVPTGGSVTALSGAFAVSLLILAVNLTLSKQMPQHSPPSELIRYSDGLRTLQGRLQTLTDADAELFAAFMQQAHTDADSTTDPNKQAHLRQHTREMPLQLARELAVGLALAHDLRPLVHSSVVSDVEAGTALLRGALEASLFTLRQNLQTAQKEGTATERFWLQWQELTKQAEASRQWLKVESSETREKSK